MFPRKTTIILTEDIRNLLYYIKVVDFIFYLSIHKVSIFTLNYNVLLYIQLYEKIFLLFKSNFILLDFRTLILISRSGENQYLSNKQA